MKTTSNYDSEINFGSLNFYPGLNLDFLPINEREELELHSRTYKIKKKTPFYCEGETPKGIYIIKKGKVKFSSINADGTEQIFFIYSVGDIFGYRPILAGTMNMHSVTAIDDCDFLFIEKENFQYILNKSDYLTDFFLNGMIKDFNSLTNMINVRSYKSIKARTAFFLLIMNEKFKLPGQIMDQAEIRISRGDLASYVGAAIENIVRVVGEFKNKDYIRVDGKSIYIRDFTALHSLADFQYAS